MSLLSAVLLLLSFQDPPLADETRFDDLGIAVRLPKGWSTLKVEAPTVVKAQAPAGGLAAGDCLVARIEADEPSTSRIFGASLLDWHQKTFPGIELVAQDDLQVAGLPARRFHLKWKELSVWKTCVARTPLILVSLDFTCDAKEEAAGKSLGQAFLDSLRFYAPAPPAGLDEAAGRAREIFRKGGLPGVLAGDSYFVVAVGDRAVGRWKVTLKPAQVRGKDGFELESSMTLPDGATGSRFDTAKGAFLADGSYQRLETERTSDRPERGKKMFRSLAVIEGGKLNASRVIDGENSEVSFDVAEGTFLNDFGDLIRSALVLAGKGQYAVRRLDPFNNLCTHEALEVAAAEAVKIGGAERPMVTVFAKVDDRRHLVYRFEQDGRWESVRLPGAKVEIRRCTRDEYEKVK